MIKEEFDDLMPAFLQAGTSAPNSLRALHHDRFVNTAEPARIARCKGSMTKRSSPAHSFFPS